jgi:trehalose 6-phosphate phosphatase
MRELARPSGLPPFAQAALLLDVDGTLIDFAPTPESVFVPPDLLASLHRLRPALGGALGVISGRAIEQVDRLLGDAPHAVAGEHGGAIRHAPGAPIDRPALPAAPAAWVEAAEGAVAAHPGARVERKARGFVLHYRAAPAAGPAFGTLLRSLLAGSPEFELLDGNMAWEVRPRGADKGRAVTALLARPPFAGRLPVFIGDDVTDHDGIRVARTMGGTGLLVADAFGGPADVRAWVARIAADGGW